MRLGLCPLVVALTLLCLPLRAAPQANTSQGQNTSQNKAEKCNQTATNKGLTGQERNKFVRTCMNAKEDASSASNNMSPQQKQDAQNAQSCEQQATQKGLTGSARRSFMKNCAATAPK